MTNNTLKPKGLCLWMMAFLWVATFANLPQAKAQTITEMTPALLPGATGNLMGTDLDQLTGLKLNDVALTITAQSATEVTFEVPETFTPGGGKLMVQFNDGDYSEIDEGNKGKLYVVDRVSPAEVLVFYEPFVHPILGNTPNGEPIDGNFIFANNGTLTATGSGAVQVGFTPAAQVGEYGGFSGQQCVQFNMQGGESGEFVLSGINTEGLENIRLTYSLTGHSGGAQIGAAGFTVSYKDGDGDWVNIGGIAGVAAVFKKVKQWRNANPLPATDNLSIKFEFTARASGRPALLDDINITGYPEGSANISHFEPEAQVVGKQVTVYGSRLDNVTGVKIGEVDITEYSVAENNKFITLTVPKGAELINEGVKNQEGLGRIEVIRSQGGNVYAATPLKAMSADPGVLGLSPVVAPALSYIYIYGSNLHNATAVKFNGVEATDFMEVKEDTLEVLVPEGVTDGPISIATANTDSVAVSDLTFMVDEDFPLFGLELSAEEGNELEETEIDVYLQANAAAESATSVDIEVSGENINDADYSLSKSMLTLAEGETMSEMAMLKILNDDDDYEEEETLIMTLTNRDGEGAVYGQGRTAEVRIVLKTPLDALEGIAKDLLIYQQADQLVINSETTDFTNAAVALYNSAGRLVRFKQVASSASTVRLSTANCTTGVYFVRIADRNGVSAKKVMIVK